MRDAPLRPGEASRGSRLAAAVAGAFADSGLAGRLTLRRATCLSGCPSPCNVAFRGERKYNLRFSRLDAADAGAVLEFAALYVASESGDVPETEWPAALRGKATVRMPPPHLLLGSPA